MPTLDRIGRFLPVPTDLCYLCGKDPETMHHIIFECPVSKLLWWNSPWTLKISAYKHLTVTQWLTLMLGPHNPLPLGEDDKHRLHHFLAVAIERIWMTHVTKAGMEVILCLGRTYLKMSTDHLATIGRSGCSDIISNMAVNTIRLNMHGNRGCLVA